MVVTGRELLYLFWPTLAAFLRISTHTARARGGLARGNLVSDAHLVALMRQHDVDTTWTSDRDFRRFDRVRVLQSHGSGVSRPI